MEEHRDHPVLRGVEGIWGPSDVYRTYPEGGALPQGCTPLVLGQPLMGRDPDDPINGTLIPLPVAWVKTWTGNTKKTARVFHSTMGSARDFQNAGLRRLTLNAVYWCLARESDIDGKRSVDYVGDYKPLASGFNYKKLKVVPKKPSVYR